MKKTVPIELPHVVSTRMSEADLRRLVTLAQAGRRTLSQTVRLLLEAALKNAATTV
jgi:hypothetical protein